MYQNYGHPKLLSFYDQTFPQRMCLGLLLEPANPFYKSFVPQSLKKGGH